MIPRRTLLAGAGVLAAPALLHAASRAPLRVGSQRGGLQSLLEASGQARDLPYRIEWSEWQAAQPLLEALNAGAVDIGSMGDLNFFSVYANGAALKIVGATRSSGASQAIVVRDPAIGAVSDLRGRKVAAARGGWTHYSLFRILEQAGVKPNEVDIAWLLPSDAVLAFRTGAIHAWSAWEPFTSLEVVQFGARVLADAKGLTPSASVMAAGDAAIRDKAAEIADFNRRVAAGWVWANGHLPEYARSTAALIRQPVPVIERAYAVSRQHGISIDAPLLREFQEAINRAVGYGIVSRRFDVAQAVDPCFLDKAAG